MREKINFNMYRRHAIMLYLIHMVHRDVLKKLILILISPPPNVHPAHPTTPTPTDHPPQVTPQPRNVVVLVVPAAIRTPAIVHHHLVVPVDTAILPPLLELCPMAPNIAIIHTVPKMDGIVDR